VSGTARPVELSAHEARDWLQRSLAGGHQLSAAVLAAAPFDRGRLRALVPSDITADHITKFHEGGVVKGSVADAALAPLLDDLTQSGAACVVVEDDVARRSDPFVARISIPSAFFGDRVVHWCDLEPGSGAAAAKVIRSSAFGYPLNAFVATKSCADLGLINGRSLGGTLVSAVVGSLLAVIVSAFDNESFLVWDAA
jgi:hypothetical protein